MITIKNIRKSEHEEELYTGPTEREAALSFAHDIVSITLMSQNKSPSVEDVFDVLRKGVDYEVVP